MQQASAQRRIFPLPGKLLVSIVLSIVAPAGCLAETFLSPTEMVSDGEKIFATASTGRRVLVVDVAGLAVAEVIALNQQPTGLAFSPDRKLLYVTGGGAEGGVEVVDLERRKVRSSLTVGHTPMAPVVSPDGGLLFVCSRFTDEVVAIDLHQMRVRARIPVTREPVAALLSQDGETLIVANHLPAGAATSDTVSCAIDLVDIATLEVRGSVPLPNGSINLRNLALSPDGKHLFVPSVLARYQVPTTQLARGWVNTHALHIIDAEAEVVRWTVLLDDMSLGAANPWDVAVCSEAGLICVSHAATHEVSLIDAAALMAKLAAEQVAAGSARAYEEPGSGYDGPTHRLGFLAGIRQRIRLPGLGPRGLVVTGGDLAVAQFFSDSIALISLPGKEDRQVHTIALGPAPEMDPIRRGELYFQDAGLCFQQWQSCATCHPDGRADALNWDLLNDGIGNPKNTRSMILAHQTPPAMASGVRGSAEEAVRTGIRHIQFSIPDEAKASAIDAYLKSLEPLPSPRLVGGELSEEAHRGREIFEKARCGACHSGPYFTNQQSRDVGTGRGLDLGKAFDVPTLIEVWRTAPYLHDGRAATIGEVLTIFNEDDRHGRTSGLSEEERNALEEYILSL